MAAAKKGVLTAKKGVRVTGPGRIAKLVAKEQTKRETAKKTRAREEPAPKRRAPATKAAPKAAPKRRGPGPAFIPKVSKHVTQVRPSLDPDDPTVLILRVSKTAIEKAYEDYID